MNLFETVAPNFWVLKAHFVIEWTNTLSGNVPTMYEQSMKKFESKTQTKRVG